MHVAYLLSDLGGGTGHHLLAMLERRPADLWSAEIVSEVASTVGSEFPVAHRVLSRPAVLGRYPFLQVSRFRELEEHFRDRRPDVLHAYFFWSILYGRLLKAARRVPVLVENREDLGFNWGPHEYALLALTRHLPDRVVCVCEAVRGTVLEREGLDPARTVVIPNGVEPRPQTAAPGGRAKAAIGLDPERPVVGMVANFDRPVKGVRYFLEAAPRILAAAPRTQFLLVGGGASEARVRQEARRLGIDHALMMPGFDPNVDAYYAAMDISVLTSLAEGLSLTILESMSWGVPVVATRVGGNPEVIVDGETGFLVPPRDVRAFADAVVMTLKDRNLRRRLGAAAALRVRTTFSLEATIRRYHDLYQSLAPPR